MTTVTVNRTAAPNVLKLHEELDALSLGSYTLEEPVTYPGDVKAHYEATLSAGDQTSVSDAITNHNESQTTASEDRKAQDSTDLDDLTAKYNLDIPANWTFAANESDILNLLKTLCRCVSRTGHAMQGEDEPI